MDIEHEDPAPDMHCVECGYDLTQSILKVYLVETEKLFVSDEGVWKEAMIEHTYQTPRHPQRPQYACPNCGRVVTHLQGQQFRFLDGR